MTRVLVLCTHNSARSQVTEGWIRHLARVGGLELEVRSAGTERTAVKAEARMVMDEVGIDLSGHTSKRLDELDDPWSFDLVLTVCDAAQEACPAYPAATRRLHVSLPDPSGGSLEGWRQVRDAAGAMSAVLVDALAAGREPSEQEVGAAAERVLGAAPSATAAAPQNAVASGTRPR